MKNLMGVRETLLQEGFEQGVAIGRAEGRAIGRAEGRAEVVLNLLKTQRFTISQIAHFVNVSEYFVRKVKETEKIIYSG